jgi:hypothetical protein
MLLAVRQAQERIARLEQAIRDLGGAGAHDPDIKRRIAGSPVHLAWMQERPHGACPTFGKGTGMASNHGPKGKWRPVLGKASAGPLRYLAISLAAAPFDLYQTVRLGGQAIYGNGREINHAAQFNCFFRRFSDPSTLHLRW